LKFGASHLGKTWATTGVT